MNKLIKKTVYSILDENEKAREDDNYLIFKVVQELEPDLAGTTFANVMFNLKYKKISLESITRARRRWAEIHRDLLNANVEEARRKEEENMGNDYYNDRMLSKWEDEYLEPEEKEEDDINERLEYIEDFYCDEIKGID